MFIIFSEIILMKYTGCSRKCESWALPYGRDVKILYDRMKRTHRDLILNRNGHVCIALQCIDEVNSSLVDNLYMYIYVTEVMNTRIV